MNETERIVRLSHESWELRDPERGTTVIADDCHFEDVARGELLSGPEGYRAAVEFANRGTVPPSGRFMEARYCSVMRVADD